jgi:ABC-type transporter Mla subunit MlaD
VIRVYAETPFVLQLALRQEHFETCKKLLDLASAGTIGLALPLVALIEPLSTMRLRASKRNELNDSWSEEARQLSRTDEPAYRDAARALQQALLKTAEMVNDERKNLNDVIARIGTCAKILAPTVDQFAEAYVIEGKGPTSLDALALSCILNDARTLDESTDRALLAFDLKAISAPIREDLKGARIKVFGAPDQLAPWLASKGVTLTLPPANADRIDGS